MALNYRFHEEQNISNDLLGSVLAPNGEQWIRNGNVVDEAETQVLGGSEGAWRF